MSNLSVVRLNGVDYNLEDENVRAMIAPTEASSTASAAHATGTYFILADTLYTATADIAIGDTIAIGNTITPGVNCAQIVLCDTMGVLNHNMDVIVNALEDLSELLKEQHNPSAAAIIDQAILDLDTLG